MTTNAPAKPKPVTVKAAIPYIPRAMPADPNIMTTERIAAYQVALERIHFSCGFVDGTTGMRTERVLRAYQQSHGLPVTGKLDQATRDAIGEPGEPFTDYTVTEEDMKQIVPTPKSWVEKSKQKWLGYNDAWEMLRAKFHCTIGYLKALNPQVKDVQVGTTIIGPQVFPETRIVKANSLRVILGETTIQALDAKGNVIAHFPCSIAKDKNKRPNGQLTVLFGISNPDYTFDPKVLFEAAEAEHITKKMVVPPGPNNPVGTTWIALSLPGYGMHGTPDPEAISRTQSHGCFRLANWNAAKLNKMIKPGMVVDVVP